MGLFDKARKAAASAAEAVSDAVEKVPSGTSRRKLEEDIRELQERNCQLEKMLSPEMQEAATLACHIATLSKQEAELSERCSVLSLQNDDLENEIKSKKELSQDLDETLLVEEYGLYKPKFDFANSSKYKNALKDVRAEQKLVIKDINEQAKDTNWTVNNNRAQGRKMVLDIQKLLIRAFNSECDDLVSKVKTSNIEKTVERIRKSAETISKLGKVIGISVPSEYTELKVKEAYLAYEFARAKEIEKEEIREAKAREREELKVQKEIEAKRKQLEKEKKQYEKALEDAKKQLERASEDEAKALADKIAELSSNLEEVSKGIQDVDYREANKRAGFVYVISNIGSFGKDVYKIGMTRRLDPMERISELSDASVPFNFDVHALIFSDDAPGLEAALHREFESRKMNLVNTRREFFRCTLGEIEDAVLRNYDKTVEFTEVPEAEQYRESELMRKELPSSCN